MVTDRFAMNGYFWKVRFVPSNHPMLVDRTGTLTIGTTDPRSQTVFLANDLQGDQMLTVFLHELGHCALYSFGFLDYIHRMVRPEYWVEMEEFICNFLADYGMRIFQIAFRALGYDAWKLIPSAYEKFLA